MRKTGTILSPECKTYAKDITDITGVDEYINLQYLRLIENLVCQRICEQVLDNKKEDVANKPVEVEIPLIGNLIITPVRGANNNSLSFMFSFEALPTFKKHISQIYTNNTCELISLLSETYSKELVETYENVLGEMRL
jgi:hypothetical protein